MREIEEKGEQEELEQENAAKADYIAEHLELYDLSAKYTGSSLERRVPGVLFKLRNKGERTLAKVKVVVYFEDAKGSVLTEQAFVPVGGVSWFSEYKPLKPGYIWQMEQGLYYPASSVPSEWKEGAVSARITDIEFSTAAASLAIRKGLEKEDGIIKGLEQEEMEQEDAAKAELDAIKADYIAEHLELYDLSAKHRVPSNDISEKYINSQLGGAGPRILFKLRNKGERTLAKVKVVVYFEDAKGGFIAEEAFEPVGESSYSDDKPLKPGYIREIERRVYPAKSVPSEWKEGAVSARITDIEFSTAAASLAIRKGLEKEDGIIKGLEQEDAIIKGLEQEDAIKTDYDTAKADYIAEHLELYDLSAKYRDLLLSGRVPGVLFKLRNKGERSLDRIKVVVYFEDAKGSVLAEEDFLPVGVSRFSDDKPLKPGYIWQMEQGKFYAAESVPSEWKEGAVSAKVTDIEFSE